MDNYYVYKHTNKINNKKYIGITKQNPENRWGINGSNYRESPHFWNAINKYGWDNFEHDILYSGLTKDEACEIEKNLIKEFNTQDRNFGYNTYEGGDAPSIPLEVRKKMSKSMMGNKNGLGHPCSEEKKRKISEAQIGRHFSEERRNNISKAKKGKTHKPISAEARKKISDSHSKKEVYCIENDTIYPSIQECGRQLHIDATTICACCKGRVKSSKGYHFRYNDSNNV